MMMWIGPVIPENFRTRARVPFQYKDRLSEYKDFHFKAVTPSDLYKGNLYIGKMVSLYWWVKIYRYVTQLSSINQGQLYAIWSFYNSISSSLISLPSNYPKLGYNRDLRTWRLVISKSVPVTMRCHYDNRQPLILTRFAHRYEDWCATSRYQEQGQVVTSHIICGM